MEQKEKAKELVSLMLQHQMIVSDEKYSLNNAKQCALICVDEIINVVDLANTTLGLGLGGGFQLKSEIYWKEVKQEINNL